MKKHNNHTTIILIIVILIGIIVGFKVVNKKVTPLLMETAKEETNKLSTMIINDAINKQVVNGISFDKLFILTYNKDGTLATIDFDSVIVNKVLTTITNNVELNIKYLEQGNIELLELSDNILVKYDDNKLKQGIIYEVPLWVSYNNPFITNLAPRIPVKINLIGSVDSNVRTEIRNYGINNALIETFVDVTVYLKVILPFQSQKTEVKTSVPIAIKMINGHVPEYYGGNSSLNLE